MIEGARMILQRRMQVGLRGVAGVAGFGEQRQIGQTKAGDQFAVGVEAGLVFCGRQRGLGENAEEHTGEQAKQTQGNYGRSQHLHLQQTPDGSRNSIATGAEFDDIRQFACRVDDVA